MSKKISVEWCGDKRSSNYGYTFWQNGKIIAKCEESDYHETVDMLEKGDTENEYE